MVLTSTNASIIFKIQRSLELMLSKLTGSERCVVCNFSGLQKAKKVLWPDLISEWELSPQWIDWYNDREGRYCVNCKCSARSNQLAKAILMALKEITGIEFSYLGKAFENKKVQELKIAEINSVGNIHPFLAKSPNLLYSEYASADSSIPSENLLQLSYNNNSFDMVLTSETLEHVPDIDISFSEIHRILKPGGMHVFTIPVIWNRPQTRVRAKIENGELVNLLPPSYHGSKYENQSDYLVFYEFGKDIVQRCKNAGFAVQLLRDANNLALVTFITTKQ